jgi:L-alanine-DL-glutamate epimerase-like enolase superfamily enzyme
VELGELAAEAQRYKDEGYQAMKLRFGWGPVDGAGGMERNLELVRTVRECIGDGIDLMADAYMGWTLDYAKRMLPLLEPFHLRWLEEPVVPDDIQGYAELSRAANMNSRFTVSGTYSRLMRWITSSSIPIAWGASRRPAKSPPSPKLIPSR